MGCRRGDFEATVPHDSQFIQEQKANRMISVASGKIEEPQLTALKNPGSLTLQGHHLLCGVQIVPPNMVAPQASL